MSNKYYAKAAEKKLNKILGFGLHLPSDYYMTLVRGNNIPFRKKFNLPSKIKKQIMKEFNEDLLGLDEFEGRVEELVFERCEGKGLSYEDIKKLEWQKRKQREEKIKQREEKIKQREAQKELEIKQREKLKIDSLKNEILDNLPYKLTVKVPYQSTGVASTIVGSAALGGFGAWLSSSEEGCFKWKDTNLMVLKTGISLSDFSTTILYKDVI